MSPDGLGRSCIQQEDTEKGGVCGARAGGTRPQDKALGAEAGGGRTDPALELLEEVGPR